MNHRRVWPLTALRLVYLALGSGTCIAGVRVLAGGEPGLTALVETAGILAIAAATWVTSERRGRGALASIGIVIGPLPAAGVAFIAGSFLATFGHWSWAAGAIGVIALCLALMALMWRASRRPWETPQPAAR